jgi:hypothetical protein
VGGGLLLGWGGARANSNWCNISSCIVLSAVLQAVVGGGLLLGWGGVNWMLAQQSSGGSNTSDTFIDIDDGRSSGSGSSSREEYDYESRKKAAEDDKDVRRVASELRQFDELLARAEERRRG